MHKKSVLLLIMLLIIGQPFSILASTQRQKRSQKQQQKQQKQTVAPINLMSDEQRVMHILSRITYGPRGEDIERVKLMGVDAYIDEQLTPDNIDETKIDQQIAKLSTLRLPTPSLIERFRRKPDPKPDPNKANQNKPEQNRPDANRPDQNKTGQNKTGQNKTDQNKTDQNKAELNKSDNGDTSASMMISKEMMMNDEQNDQKGNKEGTKSITKDFTKEANKDLNKDLNKDQKAQSDKPANDKAQNDKNAADKAKDEKAKSMVKPPMDPNPQDAVVEIQRAAFLRAVSSNKQLYEMVVNFWENHFSIYIQKDAERLLYTSFDRDAIRPFALGRFRDLLGATAHSPAMLYYLDNWQSNAPLQIPATKDRPARTVGGINENYARELMELHTLGVNGGYTQKDVQEVARCFTGWTIRKPTEEGLFIFNPSAHDNGEKIVLGTRIAPGGGISDGEKVLDILAKHPSTARFLATKLARKFIGDEPPISVIDRAAEVFLKTDGSIKETLRAILTAPEFFARDHYRNKVRSPFEYAVSMVRMLGAESDGNKAMLEWIARMGEPIYGRLTPEGYPDRAETWTSNNALLERLNFSVAIATNKIAGTRLDMTKLFAGTNINDANAVAAHLTKLLLNGEISKQTREAINNVINGNENVSSVAVLKELINNVTQQKNKKPVQPAYIENLIALLMGAPESQKR